ncbi:hypothetical protein P22_1421 [Propionispora sp. 2/2-37]|uniref:HAMP domain-containing sensor histidine kinase n=1 Tax=Propionispora sp. 2/2-37 TaxID=1677858 RepID=UPI0006BB5838|nr:HAMP domain-containing sensor histidine kinase [Propionispora sp. 2/2-37]CUH95351.1 hypothetical protein P22_1421 [Propionispora sp. 2/2-37]
MKVSLQYKLLAAFMAVVVLVLAGVGIGGSILIRDYFIASKRHELTDKAYEMARMVNAYYDGQITREQLHNFVNSVDSFLDARVWVVDQELNLITVSEEQPREAARQRRPAPVIRPSPMRPGWRNCDPAGNQGGMMMGPPWQQSNQSGDSNNGSVDGGQGRQKRMRGHGMGGRPGLSDGQPVQSSFNATVPSLPAIASQLAVDQALTINREQTAQGNFPLVLDMGKESQAASGAAVSLTDITGMSEIIQAVQANYGQVWAKTYYHPYYEENMLIVAVPLQRSDGSMNGTVMINAPLTEFDGFLQHVYAYLAYAGLAAILFAMGLAAYMARGIVRPLKAMKETAAAMARGDYARRVTVADCDEVGELGHSLNSLAQDLGDYVRQMEVTENMRREFVANVSHELRTPLTILHGYNQALQDGTITDPAKVKKYYRIMGDEIQRLEKLIADLLDLSQLQANGIVLELEDVSLGEVVDNVNTLLKQKSEAQGVTLAVDTDPVVPSIRGDGDRLTQLVLILMDNALKFTPAGGQITTRLVVEDKAAVLTIADTGMGIAAEDLPHVWERFYKADKSRASGGTGLGLAIARQIIELHGATVDVASVCGEGTAFTIRFPVERNNTQEVK